MDVGFRGTGINVEGVQHQVAAGCDHIVHNESGEPSPVTRLTGRQWCDRFY